MSRSMGKSDILMLRLWTALIGLIGVLLLVYAAPYEAVRASFVAFASWTTFEFSRLTLARIKGKTHLLLMIANPLLTALIFAAATTRSPAIRLPIILVGLISSSLLAVFSEGSIEERATASSGSFLAVGYTICTWLAVWNLYELSKNLLILVLGCAWGSDTGAYFFGRIFGKRKLAPVLSPNKTWEGSIGGLLSGVAAVVLFHIWLRPLPDWRITYWVALLGSIAAQAGDLFKSLFKRNAGVKDSGKLLPGHGGLLDRIDSVLLASLVVWMLISLFPSL
ncbi:MAG: phosphatidate cytidylyltransferase [Pseudomonadota bacterium]